MVHASFARQMAKMKCTGDHPLLSMRFRSTHHRGHGDIAGIR
jgi:hypothetical protein